MIFRDGIESQRGLEYDWFSGLQALRKGILRHTKGAVLLWQVQDGSFQIEGRR